MRILAADIGGTHCRFAVFENSPAGPGPSGDPCRLRTAEVDSLAALLDRPYAHGDAVGIGSGLALLHRFHTGRDLSPEAVAAELTPDSPTLVWFARFYARACRNYALAVLATGGLYVSGGVAARNENLVLNPHFCREFVSSPSHGPLLERLPVRLNANKDSGLFGAAFAGVQALGSC